MSPRARIAVDVTPAVRQGAGIGRYARELAAALVRRGTHDYVPFAADRVPREQMARTVGAVPGDCRSSILPAKLHGLIWHGLGLRLPAERWTGPVAAWHATDFVAPPLSRAALVATVHDLSYVMAPERSQPGLRRYLSRHVPATVSRAAAVLADSQNTKRDIVALLGADPEKVTVAYPGVRADMRRVTDVAALAAVAKAHHLDRPFVLGVGTLEPRKDWPTLIAAFESALGPTHALVLVGRRGWMTESLDRAVEACRADVRLLGFVPDRDLPAIYSLASAFAYPSVYEGFGLPPLEAMACGVPTVVAGTSCLPEVVGDAALKVAPGDAHELARALRRLVNDRRLRARLGRAGPERSAHFTWDACAKAVEAAYSSVLRAAAGPTAQE